MIPAARRAEMQEFLSYSEESGCYGLTATMLREALAEVDSLTAEAELGGEALVLLHAYTREGEVLEADAEARALVRQAVEAEVLYPDVDPDDTEADLDRRDRARDSRAAGRGL